MQTVTITADETNWDESCLSVLLNDVHICSFIFRPYGKQTFKKKKKKEKTTLGKDLLSLTHGIKKKLKKGLEYTFGGLERADLDDFGHVDKKGANYDYYSFDNIEEESEIKALRATFLFGACELLLS